MLKTIQEGRAQIKTHIGKISKELPVFYNPVMESNRDISITVLRTLKRKNMQIALPLAASGIRGIRFLKELPKSMIKTIAFNDHNPSAVNLIKKNIKLNNLKDKKVEITKQDANLFLLNSKGFDYIDIDPFGSPNPFLNNAVQRLSRNGLLAVTSTDTSALTGTFPKITGRKYWAQSHKNEMMHELGLRIIIRKVQLVATQFEKALTPIFAYYKDHYYRIFFQNKKSKQACDQIIEQHQYFLYNPKTLEREISKHNQKNNFLAIGPLWTGPLFDKKLVSKIQTQNKFLQTVKKESKLNIVGFYDLHKIAKNYQIKIKSTQETIKKLGAVPTHFSSTGFKSNLDIKKIISLLKKL